MATMSCFAIEASLETFAKAAISLREMSLDRAGERVSLQDRQETTVPQVSGLKY